MFFLFSAFSFERDDIASKAEQAARDDAAFEALSREFEKHNRALASRVTGRFITESDDEWSVVLLAFYEAVKGYDRGRGSFMAFADMVIKRRLIDHIRSQSAAANTVAADMSLADGQADEDGRYGPAARRLIEESESAMQRDEESQDIRSEIEALDRELKNYGIAFSDLPAVSPKAEKTRIACARAAMYVCEDDGEYSDMKRTRRLPAGSINKNCGIPRKLLENHRKYIIAVIEIIKGDYPRLAEFTAELRRIAADQSVER